MRRLISSVGRTERKAAPDGLASGFSKAFAILSAGS